MRPFEQRNLGAPGIERVNFLSHELPRSKRHADAMQQRDPSLIRAEADRRQPGLGETIERTAPRATRTAFGAGSIVRRRYRAASSRCESAERRGVRYGDRKVLTRAAQHAESSGARRHVVGQREGAGAAGAKGLIARRAAWKTNKTGGETGAGGTCSFSLSSCS
jgi:hypothetical protein